MKPQYKNKVIMDERKEDKNKMALTNPQNTLCIQGHYTYTYIMICSVIPY